MLQQYRKHVEERAAEGVVPKPLDAEQTTALVELIKNPPKGEEEYILNLLANRVPAGVDEAAYVKAGFLTAIAKGEVGSPILTPSDATELLGTMLGGYNISPLIDLLDNPTLAPIAAKGLSNTLLIFDAFHDIEEKAKSGNMFAKQVIQSWADAEWFTNKPNLPEKMTVTVFKVTGETNTDDLSPAPDAWSRPDIPLHAKAMLKMPREGITNAELQIEDLQEKGFPVAYVGDVVGTGSSRKSATNSVLWFIGDDIP
ncbi:MAG: bifunctional aconitate hydratase 2/2-methylisocitrate dehydratase, partial [Pseudomonadota bacterium]